MEVKFEMLIQSTVGEMNEFAEDVGLSLRTQKEEVGKLKWDGEQGGGSGEMGGVDKGEKNHPPPDMMSYHIVARCDKGSRR